MEQLRDTVLQLVRQHGPVLPVQISKLVNRDILFASAILSELVDNKLIKISHAKIGSSPVYYAPGQEEKLQILYNGLPEKEKQAYNLLKERKILRDKGAEPAIRVALRSIRDFALPIEIELNNEKEIFWRWHLISQYDAQSLIKAEILIAPKQPQQEVQQPSKTIELKPETRVEQKFLQVALPEPKPKAKTSTPFLDIIKSFTSFSKIEIVEHETVRKNTEFNFIARIPSNIGPLDFFISAKNKKSISEADLSLAHQKGVAKKLPVLFLTTGNLTKKASVYMEKNLKGYLIYKQIT